MPLTETLNKLTLNRQKATFKSKRFHKPRDIGFVSDSLSRKLTPTYGAKGPYLKHGLHQTLESDFDRGLKELSLRVRYKVGPYPTGSIPSQHTLFGSGVVTSYDPWANSAIAISEQPSTMSKADEQSSLPAVAGDNEYSEEVMESNNDDLAEEWETDAVVAGFDDIDWMDGLGLDNSNWTFGL